MTGKKFTFELDSEFIKKVDWLKKYFGYKSRIETIKTIIEEEYKNDIPSDCPTCKYFDKGFCNLWKHQLEQDMYCNGYEQMEASE